MAVIASAGCGRVDFENGAEQCGMIYSPSIGSGWNDADCSKALQIACSR
jgi:hypothetical protein